MTSEGERAMLTLMRWAGLPDPNVEYPFHPKRKWRFDFAWPAQMVALEVEGGTWIDGAHNRGGHFESDAEKYNEAVLLGWTVIRVTTGMVDDGRAIGFIGRALA